MTSVLAAPPDLLGDQRPRVSQIPPYTSTTGPEAIELAAMAGLELDPWQQWVLTQALGERSDAKWAAFGVGLVVSRQNGKGGLLEARELAGLFLLGERLIIHSAHQFDTSQEAFERLVALIENTPTLSRRLAKNGISRSHGSEGIRLKNGQRIRFRTRTKGGGRGFTADCLVLDEAMILPDAFMGAVLPTLSARPNPQVWYTGSAVDQTIHEHGLVLARVRERGRRGTDPSLFYAEWSVADSLDSAGANLATLAEDPRAWARANPALGIRITPEYVGAERREFDSNLRGFAVERLGIGDWPRTDGGSDRIIPLDDWRACADPKSQIKGEPVFAVDADPQHKWGSIGVAGKRADGHHHVEIVEHRSGVDWIVRACATLPKGSQFVIDPRGPAASLIADLKEAGIEPVEVQTQDYVRACAQFVDAVKAGTLHYLPPQPELDAATAGATTRTLGDSWAWARKTSTADISSLVACTLALWGSAQRTPPKTVHVYSVAELLAQADEGGAPGNA